MNADPFLTKAAAAARMAGKIARIVYEETAVPFAKWFFSRSAPKPVKVVKTGLFAALVLRGAAAFVPGGAGGADIVRQEAFPNAGIRVESPEVAPPMPQGQWDALSPAAPPPAAPLREAFPAPGMQIQQAAEHMRLALSFAGQGEHSRQGEVQQFIRQMGPAGGINIDETMWCAAFMNAVECSSGRPGTGGLSAAEFLKYGTPVTEPQHGDIAVLYRTTRRGPGYHVGYVWGGAGPETFHLLGGNQEGEGVSIGERKLSDVVGYVRPPYHLQKQVNTCLMPAGPGRR